MFRQIVVDDQGIPPALGEFFPDGAAGVGGDVLQRRRLVGSGHDDDRVLQRAETFQRPHRAGDGRPLLPDGDVDADQVLALLVDDGVHGDGRLARLTVADDQLALASADRDHRIDGDDPGLHRGVHVLALDDTRRDPLDWPVGVGNDRTLAVDRLAERIDHAPDQAVADRHRGDAPGAADPHPLFDAGVFAHDDDADGIILEVEGDPPYPIRELDQFLGLHVGQTGDAGDPIAGLEHGADILDL